MNTAVILASFNGIKYIKEQLDSIRCQTIMPDNVVIGDDCSDDGTVDFVRNYIGQYHLGNWRVVARQERLGWKRNFRDLLQRTDADYIFFCDQDDQWREDKCEKMVRTMEEHQDALCLASDMKVVYESGKETRIIFNGKDSKAPGSCKTGVGTEGTGDLNIECIPFDRSFTTVKRPGCTYCIRKSLRDQMLMQWEDDFPHDAVAWRLAVMQGGLYILHDELMEFRRHPESATSLLRRNTRAEEVEELDLYIRMEKMMLRVGDSCCLRQPDNPYKDVRPYIEEHLRFMTARRSVFEKGNIFSMLPVQLKWHAYYPQTKSMLADYYYMVHK